MLQTTPNIKNDLFEIIANKEDKIHYIKEYYISQDSFEVRIPKYILIELLQDYEYVLQSISNIINKPEDSNINTINSNNLQFNDTKDINENNMIIELAKELNLQFDYSQYAEILISKPPEENKKADVYDFNDLDRESDVNEEHHPVAIKQGLRHKIKSGLKSTEFSCKIKLN
jgi:hypothetical protein